MKLPVMQGLIDRRVLVNFRIDPAVLSRQLPEPFRPKIAHGFGIAGICLIRLKDVRPSFAPSFVGVSSENAAHRIAVQWKQDGATREGVYIPRRDTDSFLNAAAGGKIFPGEHHLADFSVNESEDRIEISLAARDGETRVEVAGGVAADIPDGSIFESLDEVSSFFESGSLGYSATKDASRFDGLELKCKQWKVEPLAIDRVRSSFFDDRSRFPAGSIAFDCALLMRGIEHEWHSRADLMVPQIESA